MGGADSKPEASHDANDAIRKPKASHSRFDAHPVRKDVGLTIADEDDHLAGLRFSVQGLSASL